MGKFKGGGELKTRTVTGDSRTGVKVKDKILRSTHTSNRQTILMSSEKTTRTRKHKEFISKCLVPLLRRLGLQHVRDTHGMDEYGRDIIFYDTDRFGIEKPFGAQAVVGDISGAAGTQLDRITAQINDAFGMPFVDIRKGEKKFIGGLYLIISGRFKRNAKEKICEKCRGKPMYFLDGQELQNLEAMKEQIVSDAATAELTRLKREALAASRCDPEDIQLFEQKLHEIDLVEGCSELARIEALSDLCLEVPLNSDSGAQLLIAHLLWQTAGWDKRSLVKDGVGLTNGRRILEALASILWHVGVEAIVYKRNRETIKQVTIAMLEIAEKAKLIEAKRALASCRNALNSMRHSAHSEKRSDVIPVIQTAIDKMG